MEESNICSPLDGCARTQLLPGLLSVLLICSIPFLLPHAADADCPTCSTHEFHGTVSNNGKVAGAGYVVTAVVNGQELAAATTDAGGKWGASQTFTVSSPAGSLIDFYVNGVLAGSGASCIATNELNLAVYGAPPPSGSATSSDSPVTAEDTPSVPGTADSQHSVSPRPSTGPSSTLTFFIGPQPSATHTSPFAIVIPCSLPGQQDNLTLSSGVLSSPEELDSAGGAIELDFTANTTTNLVAGQQLTVEPTASAPSAPVGSEIIAAYSLQPENSTFTPPLTLKLKYDRDKLPAGVEEGNLYIAQLTQPGEWTALPSSIDMGSNKVSVEISHFSIYGLMGRLTPPSSIITPSVNDPEAVPPPVQPPIAETIPAGNGNPAAPAGPTSATQTSIMNIFAPGILVTGAIIVIVLFLAIIRKRARY